MKIQIKVLNKEFYRVDKMGGSYYDLPQYQTSGSAAMDLVCTEDVILYPGECGMIKTGLAIWIGSGSFPLGRTNPFLIDVAVAGLIVPRSGLGTKGLVLGNTVGVIDEDYQGELMVSAWNRNNLIYTDSLSLQRTVVEGTIKLKAGDRFCQLMFVPVIKAQWDIVEEFSGKTYRGENGFGSTDDYEHEE